MWLHVTMQLMWWYVGVVVRQQTHCVSATYIPRTAEHCVSATITLLPIVPAAIVGPIGVLDFVNAAGTDVPSKT